METPETKAKEIVFDYYCLISSQFVNKRLCETFARELANRCVYEVKKYIPEFVGGRVKFENPDIIFWNEVENLIDKIKIP